jgi:hypothetical protein
MTGRPSAPCLTSPYLGCSAEVPVAIVFLEEVAPEADRRQYQVEVARRMRAARHTMPPLGVSVKELIETGRER